MFDHAVLLSLHMPRETMRRGKFLKMSERGGWQDRGRDRALQAIKTDALSLSVPGSMPSPWCNCRGPVSFRAWQREEEPRARARRTLGPDAAPMHRDIAPGDAETELRTLFGLSRRRNLRKFIEHERKVLRRNAAARVGDARYRSEASPCRVKCSVHFRLRASLRASAGRARAARWAAM